jgi:hypothetical protein
VSTYAFRLVSALLVIVGVAACTPTPSPAPTPAPGGTSPSSGAGAPSTPAGPALPEPPPAAGALAIYYLVSDRGSPRLIREFHRLPVGDGSPAARTRAAVTEMLDGSTAFDLDYSSLWPASAAVRAVNVTGDTVTVDLSGALVNGAGSVGSQQAVQQLVWTTTAASGKPAVRITLDGAPVDELWDQVDVREPLRRGPAIDVLAAVWLIDPQQNAVVGREFTLHLAGIVFEATLNYEIRRAGTVVKSGAVTLGAGAPAQGDAKVTMTLEPGTYVIEAFDISENDSSRIHADNHTVTVR